MDNQTSGFFDFASLQPDGGSQEFANVLHDSQYLAPANGSFSSTDSLISQPSGMECTPDLQHAMDDHSYQLVINCQCSLIRLTPKNKQATTFNSNGTGPVIICMQGMWDKPYTWSLRCGPQVMEFTDANGLLVNDAFYIDVTGNEPFMRGVPSERDILDVLETPLQTPSLTRSGVPEDMNKHVYIAGITRGGVVYISYPVEFQRWRHNDNSAGADDNTQSAAARLSQYLAEGPPAGQSHAIVHQGAQDGAILPFVEDVEVITIPAYEVSMCGPPRSGPPAWPPPMTVTRCGDGFEVTVPGGDRWHLYPKSTERPRLPPPETSDFGAAGVAMQLCSDVPSKCWLLPLPGHASSTFCFCMAVCVNGRLWAAYRLSVANGVPVDSPLNRVEPMECEPTTSAGSSPLHGLTGDRRIHAEYSVVDRFYDFVGKVEYYVIPALGASRLVARPLEQTGANVDRGCMHVELRVDVGRGQWYCLVTSTNEWKSDGYEVIEGERQWNIENLFQTASQFAQHFGPCKLNFSSFADDLSVNMRDHPTPLTDRAERDPISRWIEYHTSRGYLVVTGWHP